VIEDPLTHHAMHLAKVREFCSKNPMEILKLSRAAASKNYSALSLVDMYAKIRHSDRTVSSEDSRRSVKDKSSAGVGKGNAEAGFTMKTYEVSSSDAGDLDFDDLETIEKGLEAKDEADSNEEKRSFSKSVWLNLTGGGKAAKFKV
jgi:hypothetical protein